LQILGSDLNVTSRDQIANPSAKDADYSGEFSASKVIRSSQSQ
jgi:hypothetical protein